MRAKMKSIRLIGLGILLVLAFGAVPSAQTEAGPAQAWACGNNSQGQLGNGGDQNSDTPVEVSNMADATAVSAGGRHSLAIRADKTTWAWGDNTFGNLGNGTTDPSAVPVQVTGLADVAAVSAGFRHSLAVKGDNRVWSWGWNDFGQLGDGSTDERHAPVQVTGLTGVKAVSAGDYFSLALKIDGTVWGWGANYRGQLGTGSTTPNEPTPVRVGTLTHIVAIAAGGEFGLALKDDGTVWAWGYNRSGQLGDGTQDLRSSPVQVSNIGSIVEIGAGNEHALAMTIGGEVWSWGDGEFGQLGINNRSDQWLPVQVTGVSGVSHITSGDYHCFAVVDDGTVWGWGTNTSGELGLGDTGQGQFDSPAVSLVYRDPADLDAGGRHTLAVGGRLTDCQVTCTADVSPTTGFFPLEVTFSAAAVPVDCVTEPTYMWFFGTGESDTGPNVTYTYTYAGTFPWTLEVKVDGKTCTQSGAITVSDPVCVLTCDATASTMGGNLPLEVTFTAASTTINCSGEPMYEWDFGDGGTGAGSGVSHTYTVEGNYNWTMTASVDGKTCSKSGAVAVLGSPCAMLCGATFNTNSGPWPLEVQFQGWVQPVNCQGDPSYFWEFGDGATSPLQNPSHTYSTSGVYTWVITVTLDGRTCSSSSIITVTDPCVLACSSVTSNPSGQAPWTVSFEGYSSGTNCSGQANYHWDFGDGDSVNTQFPNHTYTWAGTYNWTLTVTQDTDTCTQTGTVTVLQPDCQLTCTGSASPESGEAPLEVMFSATATAENCADTPRFQWRFGDGQLSTQQNPTHLFDTRGNYPWTLTVYADGLECVQSGTVVVSGPPCAVACDASAAPLCGIAPMNVSFTGSAELTDCIVEADYLWQFGDGETSSELSPEHVYQVQGDYEWTFSVFAEDEICTVTGSVFVTLDGVGCLPGDCDLNGTVSIGEVQKVIRMHLRLDPVGCGADCNGDGIISIGELQKVINAHLRIPTSC